MFKRDTIVCIRTAGSSDTPIILPVVDDSIDLKTKAVSSSETRTTLANPQFTDLMVNRGKQESTLSFTTYIKPYKDGNIYLPEALLHESLMGTYSTSATEITTDTTANSYILKKFDIYLINKLSKATFSIKNAVTLSAEYMFDLKGIARIKWTVAGVNFSKDTYPTPVPTYPTEGQYIKNIWAQTQIDFPQIDAGRSYTLATTNISLKIENSIKFAYNEVTTKRFTYATDRPVIDKRDIDGKLKIYLKVQSLDLYQDLITAIETTSYLNVASNMSIKFSPCTSTNYIEIVLNNIMLKYPDVKIDEVYELEISYQGTDAIIYYRSD